VRAQTKPTARESGRVAPAASSSLVVLREGDYSERRKATMSDCSCLVRPMPKPVLQKSTTASRSLAKRCGSTKRAIEDPLVVDALQPFVAVRSRAHGDQGIVIAIGSPGSGRFVSSSQITRRPNVMAHEGLFRRGIAAQHAALPNLFEVLAPTSK
jgi:hypothetical protein